MDRDIEVDRMIPNEVIDAIGRCNLVPDRKLTKDRNVFNVIVWNNIPVVALVEENPRGDPDHNRKASKRRVL